MSNITTFQIEQFWSRGRSHGIHRHAHYWYTEMAPDNTANNRYMNCHVTHICVSKLAKIGSNSGLSPDWRQAILWTSSGLLLIAPRGTKFSEILIEIHKFPLKKMHLKTSSAKLRPFCLGLNVLNTENQELVVITAALVATNEDKVGIITTLGFSGRMVIKTWCAVWRFEPSVGQWHQLDIETDKMTNIL